MKMRETWLGMAVLVGSVAAPAVAQDMHTASEKIVACQDLADADERLACFDTAVAELSDLMAVPLAEVPAPAPVAPTALSASESQLIQQAAVAPAIVADAAALAAAPPVQQASVDVPAEADANGSILPSWIPRVTFGERRDVEREPDQFETTVTRIQRNNLGRHFFTTAEGHVWKQKSLDKIRAPSTLPIDVILDRNIMGGIRLRIPETKEVHPVIRVE